MRFTATKLEGARVIQPQYHEDNRGLFARTYCAREFREQGLVDTFVQCNTSWNARRGTIRGLHYQDPPSAEVKLVRCTGGTLLDVIGRYLQYHTSADDLTFVTSSSLGESLQQLLRVIQVLEENSRYLNLKPKCEPQLGRRGLYRQIGGTKDAARDGLALGPGSLGRPA